MYIHIYYIIPGIVLISPKNITIKPFGHNCGGSGSDDENECEYDFFLFILPHPLRTILLLLSDETNIDNIITIIIDTKNILNFIIFISPCSIIDCKTGTTQC